MPETSSKIWLLHSVSDWCITKYHSSLNQKFVKLPPNYPCLPIFLPPSQCSFSPLCPVLPFPFQIANETKVVVQKEENEATIKAEKTQAIADDAQRDLDEAFPMLDAALASLMSLNKNNIVEVSWCHVTVHAHSLRFLGSSRGSV